MSLLRPPPPLKTIALLLNLGLFAMGLYFELHPRDREDAWSAAGVAAVALLNSAALTVEAGAGEASRRIYRLRRVATIANALILLVAAAIVAFEAVNDSSHALVHGAALVLPPLFTLLALAGQRRR
jgi:peptidoglycan/LPS O-acetylase OafA/YrhL